MASIQPRRVFDKQSILSCLCRDKSVLNLGCVNHEVGALDLPNFQHAAIAAVAKHVVGVDYEAEGVTELRRRGYDVRLADAQQFDLTDEFPAGFDVVLASEIIEHLSNVGCFLDCVAKHLARDGILVLTTPHAYGIAFFLEVLVFGEERINDDHTATYSKKNIDQLLWRHGFKIDQFYWLTQDSSKLFVHKTRFLRALAKIFFLVQLPFVFLRRAYSKEMIVVATLVRPRDEHTVS